MTYLFTSMGDYHKIVRVFVVAFDAKILRRKNGSCYSPTAGDMEREPLEPVGLGVGLRCGVVARPAPPLPPESLLF